MTYKIGMITLNDYKNTLDGFFLLSIFLLTLYGGQKATLLLPFLSSAMSFLMCPQS